MKKSGRNIGNGGFLSRLANDTSGNTLAMMAIALIPICGIIGSGVDTARLYVVKVRLQQACDAGVLAGRKSIVNSSAPLDVSPTGQAQTFFKNNFKNGWMQSASTTFTPSKTSDNQVNGTATTSVPMTVMKMFGAADVAMTVTCQARYDVADTDVVFVLDTTGSMADKPDDSGGGGKIAFTRENGQLGFSTQEASSGSKISGVRSAVLNFYDTVASTADSSTHIRYGFVPYSVSVNVGKAIYDLNPSYLVDSYDYNSRVPAGEANDTVLTGSSNKTVTNTDNTASTACSTGVVRSPTTGYVVTGTYPNANANATRTTTTWASQTGGKAPGTCTVTVEKLKVKWNYQTTTIDTSQFKTFAATTDPTRFGNGTVTWNGCIEEMDTTANLSTFNQSSLPPDLNPDTIPSDDSTRWRPALPELSYWRNSNGNSFNTANNTTSLNSDYVPSNAGNGYPNATTTAGYWMGYNYNSDYVACPKAAKRLSVMTRGEVETYVSASGDLRPGGYTYHDAGMIWGTRFLAPNGPFANDTAAWPNRNAPNRYIVFMTDGAMTNVSQAYHLYGVEQYDARIGGANGVTTYHTARFLAECQAAGNRGIKVYVIAFGTSLTTDLKNCAKYGQGLSFAATDNAGLNTAFQNIAKQIALLRISQ
ncbi:TadE/TadG family type IV pilus assembly protein [Sphingomonas immobilis]|uniref:Pilus assembly protein n=1 Tax=Sphingomonas immobilis TaxID=3063997 RepID=A0ABT8ZZK4_9SPHN|nr:TadE/TadG family type IV pilus assembly protein [Sphingomonas sp. CA1-15]MDO7843015.1 pilus assembly protein [Sphingomonas sp. CA1-15]